MIKIYFQPFIAAFLKGSVAFIRLY